ncbi:hypothetical protein HGI47_20295 [Novosphingobium sp. ERN07]|uniref:RNA polymerase sigma factor n=1 Tax=Novosphingobium sp. ERN07 TaxID=2726187 RepID=UPI0014574AE4|nr:sigma factor [Novosphingobium sp. ERN07]NLR73214.1 hypothetical protein [Novosphingobium sp. ERN07]
MTDDAASLRDWHQSHSAWLQGYLRRHLHVQAAEAEDIVQDTWLRILRLSLTDIASPRAFLSRVALNIFRDRRRHEAVSTRHRYLV